jgi:hypothetical protein
MSSSSPGPAELTREQLGRPAHRRQENILVEPWVAKSTKTSGKSGKKRRRRNVVSLALSEYELASERPSSGHLHCQVGHTSTSGNDLPSTVCGASILTTRE